MHALYVVCLFGGALATSAFALLGRIGGLGAHGGHAHVGAAHGHLAGGHAHSAHAHAGHVHSGQASHAGPGHPAGHHATPAAEKGSVGTAGDGALAASSSRAGSPASSMPHGWMSTSVGWTLSWFSPLAIAAGVLWFGGVGLIAEGILGSLALLIAIVAGIAGAASVRALMNALVRASTPPLQLGAEGALGTVNVAIRADAPGEVIYTLEGLHRSVPAYSEDGRPIPRGATVVILRRERGFAWVESLDPLSDVDAPRALPPIEDVESRT